MKNWIIVLLIFVVPLGLYAYLESNSQNTKADAASPVAQTGKPRVIKFYSPLCSDCQKVSKEMVDVVEDYKDAVTFEEINVSEQSDKSKAMIKKYKITLVPTLIFVSKDGQTTKKIEGFIEDDEIERNIINIK